MPIATVQNVRDLGKLPSEISDSDIQIQLDAAAREITRWLGYDYSGELETIKVAALVEAESCICMSYLIPVLNILYPSGLTTAQVEYGDMNFTFGDPEDIKKLQGIWYSRAEKRMESYIPENVDDPVSNWIAL